MKTTSKNKNKQGQKIRKERKDSTTTSYFDIRKVFKFTNKILGHGNFGTVRLANDINNGDRIVAVKTIQKNKIK